MTGGIANPLIAEFSESGLVTGFGFEIFQEGVQVSQPGVGSGPVPGGDQLPVPGFGRVEPGGETGMVRRLGGSLQ